MKRWLKIMLGVVGGIVVLGALASIGGDDDDPPSENTRGTPDSPATPAATPTSAGDATPTPAATTQDGCAGDRHCATLTLSEVERMECVGEYTCADSGKEYVSMVATLKNEGREELETNPFYFKLYRGDSASQDADSATFFVENGMERITLSNGGEQSGRLVFVVPEGTPLEKLCFEGTLVLFGDTPAFCAPIRE